MFTLFPGPGPARPFLPARTSPPTVLGSSLHSFTRLPPVSQSLLMAGSPQVTSSVTTQRALRGAAPTHICAGLPLLQPGGKGVVTSFQGQILANGVAMEDTEVTAKNGRIYTLAGVLIPPSIVPILPRRCDETKSEMRLVRK